MECNIDFWAQAQQFNILFLLNPWPLSPWSTHQLTTHP
ncbi:hypothetical protein SALWKB29_1318 [Snodgrassella communis]|uniref:Uncharacterized protein n=1 Tax=Snodgrassella communis TaxID=2946699 RepID=A0A836Z2R2_9NEIS|nr:hypothetical protein SALWKB29_1318 [Snodgrassella communis]